MRRDEDGPHRLRARDGAVPAKGDGAPAPVRHAGSSLDHGLRIGLEVVGVLVEFFPFLRHCLAQRGGIRCHVFRDLSGYRGRKSSAFVEVVAPGPVVRNLFELGKDHRLDLSGGEGRERDQQDRRRGPFASVRDISPATRRQDGDEGHGDQQEEPRKTRRAGLVIGEAEGGEGEEGRGESAQAEDGEGEEEQQKEIEERPRGEPVAFRVVGPGHGEEAVAGRQVQGRAEAVGVGEPAGRGKGAAERLDAARRDGVERGTAHLEARGTSIGIVGDELGLAVHRHRP